MGGVSVLPADLRRSHGAGWEERGNRDGITMGGTIGREVEKLPENRRCPNDAEKCRGRSSLRGSLPLTSCATNGLYTALLNPADSRDFLSLELPE